MTPGEVVQLLRSGDTKAWSVVQQLSYREREVIRRRCGSTPETLEDIAATFDVSPGRIRQVEAQSLVKIEMLL